MRIAHCAEHTLSIPLKSDTLYDYDTDIEKQKMIKIWKLERKIIYPTVMRKLLKYIFESKFYSQSENKKGSQLMSQIVRL